MREREQERMKGKREKEREMEKAGDDRRERERKRVEGEMGHGFGMPRYRETEENESSAIGAYYSSPCTVLVNFYSTVVTAYRPLRPPTSLATLVDPRGRRALCSLPNPSSTRLLFVAPAIA